jgi:hypothetical protein
MLSNHLLPPNISNWKTPRRIIDNCHGHQKLQEKELSQNTIRKTNHMKCEPKFSPRLKTQRCKAKTQYMLEDDSNRTLF